VTRRRLLEICFGGADAAEANLEANKKSGCGARIDHPQIGSEREFR
jgi:hypothetical protein